MARATKVPPYHARQSINEHTHRALNFSVTTLALWRLRSTWFLLLVTMLGIIAAVAIASAVPLFSTVTVTAGLHNLLDSAPRNSALTITSQHTGMSTSIEQGMQQQLDPIFQHNLGHYLSPIHSMLLTASSLSVTGPATNIPAGSYQLALTGTTSSQIGAHIRLLQGRLPRTNPNALEVLLTPDTALAFHATTGSTFTVSQYYLTSLQQPSDPNLPLPNANLLLTIKVVGLFQVPTPQEVYWNSSNFQPDHINLPGQPFPTFFYTFLIPSDNYLTIVDKAATQQHLTALYSLDPFTFAAIYQLDTAQINSSNLSDLIHHLTTLQSALTATYGNLQQDNTTPIYQTEAQPPFYLLGVYLSSDVLPTANTASNLEQYSTRIALLNVPTLILTLQIIILLLLFVSIVIDLLVERQASAIAMMRSRGASSGQVFGALLTQGIGISLLALLIGIPLAPVLVMFMAQAALPIEQQSVLTTLLSQPLTVLAQISGYALAVAAIALITMALALRRAAQMDVLSLRQASARNTRQPFWRRLHLDIIAALLAFAGAGVSLYLGSVNAVIGTQGQALISVPLTLLAPFFLILGLLFLFLRLFPLFLQLLSYLAAHGRGASSLLAFTQTARQPTQSVRMIVLLAVAIAFTIFSLILTASQAQHAVDLANYFVGADFSGNSNPIDTQGTLDDMLARYRPLSGIRAVSAGYVGQGVTSSTSTNLLIQVRAVDANTFASVGYWQPQFSAQPLASLMAQLRSQRQQAIAQDVVPVFIDDITQQQLHLHIGSSLAVSITAIANSGLNCRVIGILHNIPTVNDDQADAGSNQLTPQGGILLDYRTYNAVYQHDSALVGPTQSLPFNTLWLRSGNDASSITAARHSLQKSQYFLTNLVDRRALIVGMQSDPLYVNLAGILLLGTWTVLLFALLGDLLASLLNVHTRLSGFVVLRALGTTPRQLASVLLWEQALIYSIALILGILLGALFALTTIPTLLFNSVTASGVLNSLTPEDFYALQHTIPSQLVIPSTLGLTLLLLLLTCFGALGLMVRAITRPSISQTLRLNED